MTNHLKQLFEDSNQSIIGSKITISVSRKTGGQYLLRLLNSIPHFANKVRDCTEFFVGGGGGTFREKRLKKMHNPPSESM